MIQVQPKFATVLALLALVISLQGRPALAQERLTGEGQAVNRVINLRTQPAQKSTLDRMAKSTSRVERSKSPIADPVQIRFDDIQVPHALQNQFQPIGPGSHAVDQKSSPSTTPHQPLGTTAQEANHDLPSAQRKVDEGRAHATPETVTIRNSMVSTEIRSPQTVNVNQLTQLQINVTNLSEDSVDHVTLVTRVGEHAKFVSATPSPSRMEGQFLEFDLQRIEGQQSQQILLNVVPTKKVPLQVGTQIIVEDIEQTVVAVQQPELRMQISGPKHSTIGKSLLHVLQITNVGDGVATDVKLETAFPSGLEPVNVSPADQAFSIQPGATMEIPFESRALSLGQGEFRIVATAEHIERQEATIDVGVHQPELRLTAVGPQLTFVQRDGIYSINLENSGEVEVTNVRVSMVIPEGMKVTTISREADVDEQRGMLSWNFDQLAPKSTEQIQLKANAVQEGEQVCNIVISSNETVEKEFRLATDVVTRADLNVRIQNLTGPVQVGANAEFLVEVENQGSREASDVSVQVALPESLVAAKNGSSPDQPEHALTFNEPLVAPGQKITFKFTATGISKGDHVVRCSLRTAGSQTNVISENSVYVYEVVEARVSEALSPSVTR